MNNKKSLKDSLYIISIKGLFLLISYSSSILLSNTSNSEIFGAFNYSIQLANILIWITLFGSTINVYNSLGKLDLSNSVSVSKDFFSSLIKSGIILLIIYFGVVGVIICIPDDNGLRIPLIFSSLFLVPLTLIRTSSAYLNALYFHKESNFLQNIPTGLMFFLSLVGISVIGIKSNLTSYLTTYLLCSILSSIIILLFLSKKGIKFNVTNLSNRFNLNIFTKKDFNLFLVTFLGFLNTRVDFILIAFLLTLKDIAIYTTCLQLILIPNVLLQVMNQILSPHIGKHHSNNNLKLIENKIRLYTKITFSISVLVSSVYIFFGSEVLNIWGDYFTNGWRILIILSLAQNVNIFFGSCGIILSICDKENLLFKINLISIIMGIPITLIFYHFFDLEGIALGSFIIVFIENILKYYFMNKYTGLKTTPSF